MKIKNIERVISLTLVVLCFLSFSQLYKMPEWLMKRPCSVHVWRQTDGASYALNYYQNNRPFFKPQVHHRHCIEGNTTSEFPIIYYIASKMYKVFGFHDYYIRWIGYSIFFITLLVMVYSSSYYTKNPLLMAMPSLILLVSPLITYYAANFLPDVPALCFAIIGFHFFIRYLHRGYRMSDFIWIIVFSTLAALLKVTAGIIFIAMLFFVFLEGLIARNKKIKWATIPITLLGIALVMGWLLYVREYNIQGGYFGNLQGLLPAWESDWDTARYIFLRTKQEWMPAMMSRKIWILLPLVMVISIFQFKRLPKHLKYLLPLSLIGTILYLIGWFKVFDVHDYYIIPAFSFVVMLSYSFISILDNWCSKKWKDIIGVMAMAFIIMGAFHAKKRFEYRATEPNWNSLPTKGFYTVEPYLRSIGIDRHKLVHIAPDPSTNISLYFANNPGYTRLYGLPPKDAVARGVEYLLIHDSSLLTDSLYLPYLKHKIGAHKEIQIFKITDEMR